MIARRLAFPIHLKARPSSEGVFEGFASTFDGPPDAYGDVVARGAFVESLKTHQKRGTMPALLWAHDMHEPVGAWQEFRETDRGLLGKGKLTLETVRGREAQALMRDGALGLSIGFRTKSDEALGGGKLLKELELVEVSLVAVPANPDARITQLKAALLQSPAAFEDALRDRLGLSAREAKRVTGGGWNALARNPEPNLDEAKAAHLAQRLASLSLTLR